MSVYTTTATAWETDLRNLLKSLNYIPEAIDGIVEWVAEHGLSVGCPMLDEPDCLPDVETIDSLLNSHWDQLCPAESWASWTDSFQWEPTPDLGDWWAHQDRAAHERGQVAPDGPRSRVVTGWTDADQARAYGRVMGS